MSTLPNIRFGESQHQLPRIGLGLAALGRPGYINIGHKNDMANDYVVEAMERRTHRMLDLAYEQGIRYIDAARSYGKAEEFLASWLRKHQPSDVFIGSKWGYTYTADWQVDAAQHEIKQHSLDQLNQQWRESSQLLPQLDLYQIHSATLDSGVLDSKPIHERLLALKDQGVMIGLSSSGQDQETVLRRALQLRVGDQYLFDAVQVTYNLMEQSCASVLQACAERGMAVIIKEGLANGRLTVRNDKPDFAAQRQQLDEIAAHYEVGIDALALAFILHQPWAQVVLSGAATQAHLQSNVQAAQLQITEEHLQQLGALATSPAAYWSQRDQLHWN